MNCNDKAPIAQVHLDFHTSPDIEGIGSNFNKEQFQEALRLGNLDSITVFAKCHHGHCYYPTKVSKMHPHLDFDLTGAMVDAAHEIGVRAPIYITAGWSDLDAKEHPEWISVLKDGNYMVTDRFDGNLGYNQPRKHCAWQFLCLNDGNGYTEHIYELTEEVCKRYKDLDGLFYDICIVGDSCYCESCQKGMKAMGFDPQNEEDAKKYFIIKRSAFMDKCMKIMKKYHPNATIFFNSGGADQYKPQYRDYQTHYEMEDLPTAWGGYDKFPMRAKYFSKYEKPFLGMTGKFHLDWGEFGGFKCKEALKAEIATMAMYGAGCSIGDHMHPDGEMELQTYQNIGTAYRYLEQIAPYRYGGKSTAKVGIYLSGSAEADEGLSNILLENQIDYDIVYADDYTNFSVVIFPDGAVLSEASLAALKAYLAEGGKLVLMGNALVQNGAFQLDFGVTYLGHATKDCDYLRPIGKNTAGLPDAPMLCNLPAVQVAVTEGDILAEILPPYFSRTYARFCGHKNTPYDKSATSLPGIVRNGNVVYLAHPMSRLYHKYGSLYHKRYLIYALRQIFTGGAFTIEGLGSQGRATMIHQPEENRYCLNMVYAAPVRRGCAEIIEDLLPLYDIKVTVTVDKPIHKVSLPLTGESLPFTAENGTLHVTIPKLQCHTTVVLEY